MFLFYHSKQKESNLSYFKGVLFESLLEQYLDASGYEVEIRRKHNSLEYDIEGVDRATRLHLIGEAKAHKTSISGQDFSAFVGKLLPLGLVERKVLGLFLSTAALTPEADNYYRSVQAFGIVSRTGKDLLNNVRNALRLPDFEPLARQLREKNYRPQQDHILTTDHGIFIVLTAGSSNSAAPAHFAVFQPSGQFLSDKRYLKELADNVPELKPLSPISTIEVASRESERIIPRGVAVGMDWTDYRFPAAPEFFIGRRDFIQRILTHIESVGTPNVLQIKSRSGVGKSSMLAFLETELSVRDISTELHDARDVKSVLDIYSLIQRFTGSDTTPQDFRDVEGQLQELVNSLNNKRAGYMVDQFESTFSNPEVFQAYESLAALFIKFAPALFICFARKNDQITTYDDSKVSLEKINSISKPYELTDFNQDEAAELIERSNSSAIRPVGKSVLAYVLEFAQGFPWLVKRTMAHIIRLSSTGVSQGELFAAGLRLDDLFDEELEGLDEIERDYLTRIAARLPADYHQLQRQFDEDPLLPRILDKLTQSRLLRLSGATYDTYNDVFKEYLVYQKLPEFRQAVIYRMSPRTILNTFHWAVDEEVFSVEELEVRFGLLRGSAFNQIRELGALNLIRRDDGRWRVPRTVIDVYHQGRLGEYVRRQLAENDVVSNLINRIAQAEVINEGDLSEYLKKQFPFVEASEKTWSTYATSLQSWLMLTRLVELQGERILPTPSEDRAKIIEGLGNLSSVKSRTGSRRRSAVHNLFMPNVAWSKVVLVVDKILGGEWPSDKEGKKVISDLKNGGWLEGNRCSFTSVEEFKGQVEKLLSSDPYTDIWAAAKDNEPLIPAIKKMLARPLKESTTRWRLMKLISWAKGVGILTGRQVYGE